MGNHIFETFVGLFVIAVGVILAYFWISDYASSTPLMIVLSLILTPIGIYMLLKVGRRDLHKPVFEDVEKKTPTKSLLEKNNEMLSSYHKTSILRDKLRVLKHHN